MTKKNENPVKIIKCKVHRTNTDPDNKDIPIVVNAVGSAIGRKVFAPGQIVDLNPTQIDILQNAIEEHEIPIADDSGIYESANPKRLAEQYYPGYSARIDTITGQITMVKRIPNYIIERAA